MNKLENLPKFLKSCIPISLYPNEEISINEGFYMIYRNHKGGNVYMSLMALFVISKHELNNSVYNKYVPLEILFGIQGSHKSPTMPTITSASHNVMVNPYKGTLKNFGSAHWSGLLYELTLVS